MVLGDNIFYGAGLEKHLHSSVRRALEEERASIYGYHVADPERFGTIEFTDVDHPIRIVEKDPNPKSNYAVTGLYFYPKGVSAMAKQIKPSARGELEITDLNNLYLKEDRIHITLLGRGYAWLDTGTHESMIDASNFVKTVEEHEGLKIACPEEIAYKNGWISKGQLLKAAETMKNNQYGQHLFNVASGKVKL